MNNYDQNPMGEQIENCMGIVQWVVSWIGAHFGPGDIHGDYIPPSVLAYSLYLFAKICYS